MNTNRALWQPGKLEMKGTLIVLDLMEVTVCLGVCVRALTLGDAGARVAGTGQMQYTAESHAPLPQCLGLSL